MSEQRDDDREAKVGALDETAVDLAGATVTHVPGARTIEAIEAPILPARYRDLGRLAAGSFGEIRRVHDGELSRVVAMKILRADVALAPRLAARFLAEAKLTAGLQHPGIVGVHDAGRLADGRLWFTMREVRGRTLGEVIDEVHESAGPDGFRETASGWTFRRLVDAFARVCQAVAYAHRRGVVHRDLKPANIMVGELGEVLVMDWGLGRALSERDRGAEDPESDDESPALTKHGDVLGTPAYMPPEQALGQRDRHGLPSDVYALGAVLYHLLSGRAPYEGATATAVLRAVIAGPPAPVVEAAYTKPVPAELAAICANAMAREMSERYADAEALAREVVAWLDGARRREQALFVMAKARAMEPEIAALRAEAEEKRCEARAMLDEARPSDPVEKKEPGWALEDEAARLALAAAVREAEWLETMQGALTVDPDLSEAHAALADHHREELRAAERAQRTEDAARAEARLRAHDRGRWTALLGGEGALSLVTDPPGAEVILERYVERGRRLVPEDARVLGVTPLREVPIQKGSHRLSIRATGRHEVRYPVLIERGEHWNGVAPGDDEPHPIALPAEGELEANEIYVPAGWCWVGGDPQATDSLPRRRVWIDGFVIRRFPVTNAEYLAFLNDLIDRGQEEEALRACPRDPLGLSGTADPLASKLVYGRGRDGRFELAGEEFGGRWRDDWPVALVDWHGASAYAAWRAARTGKPFRLPGELEREKAARGADGRAFPWGSQADPSFACVAESHAALPTRARVIDHPLDESPYGARGLGGNMRDWCLEIWRRDGPAVDRDRVLLVPAAPFDPDFRVNRGGSWTSPLERGRAAARFGNLPGDRRESVGLRLARSASFTTTTPGSSSRASRSPCS